MTLALSALRENSMMSLRSILILLCAITFGLPMAEPLAAQVYGPKFGSKAAQDFFFYIKKAQEGHDIKATPAGQFLEAARKSNDLTVSLDAYFKDYNEKALSWLKDNKIQVNLADSMDSFSKAVALNKLHENFRQRNSVKYDGPIQISLYGGESAQSHLKLISPDAAERLGYTEARKIGESNVMIKAPEGWTSYSTEFSSDVQNSEDEYIFKMPDGTEQVIKIPSMKSVAKVYTRKITSKSSEEQNSDGSRSLRQSTEVSGQQLVGFLVQNADIKSAPGKKFVIVTKDNELIYRNDFGDLSNARQVHVNSADEAIELMKKLNEAKKISANTTAIQDLFQLQLPGAVQGCTI
jgi:hypothetical protein